MPSELYGKDATAASSFHELLGRQTKDEIWDEVFALKKAYFDLIRPDIVEHIIKRPLNFQRRYELYKEKLLLPDYDITPDAGARTIWVEKKE